MSDDEYKVRMALIGDTGVGKTCLLLRLTDNIFNPAGINTLGVDHKICYKTIDDQNVMLDIWDTAGQERFRGLIKAYFRDVQIMLIVYDTTHRQSFDNIEEWLQYTDQYAGENVNKILIGTKVDLNKQRQIEFEEAQQYAEKLDIPLVETSARYGSGINNLSVIIEDEVRKCLPDLIRIRADTVDLTPSVRNDSGSCSC